MITRKLKKFTGYIEEGTGAVTIESVAFVTDDDEGTQDSKQKTWKAASVVAAAEALRDAILAQSAQQLKPYTV